jgi:hypothetical protein
MRLLDRHALDRCARSALNSVSVYGFLKQAIYVPPYCAGRVARIDRSGGICSTLMHRIQD